MIKCYSRNVPFTRVRVFRNWHSWSCCANNFTRTSDAGLRSDAEKTLVQFANSPDCLNKCQLLLERGNVRTVSSSHNIFHCIVFNYYGLLLYKNPFLNITSLHYSLRMHSSWAANTLTKLVSRPNITLPLEQRIDMRKFT